MVKKKFHFLLANIWKPRMSKSDPEPANALYVHDQATATSIRNSSTRNFLLQRQSFGDGGIHPQSLWGSGAVALALYLVCLKLSQLSSYQDVQGWSHNKLDGDGGTQFKWGSQLGCNIIRRSDE